MTFCVQQQKIKQKRQFNLSTTEGDMQMKFLLVINSNLCAKTSSFWLRYGDQIDHFFGEYEHCYPKDRQIMVPSKINDYDVIILIGDDTFFSCFINAVFYELASKKKQTALAFIPDRRNTAMASSLGLYSKVSDQCEAILKQNTLFLDLIRCHYLDKKGIPRSHFIINDAVIGVSAARLPLVLKTIAAIAKHPPILSTRNPSKHIVLQNGGETIYSGGYSFAAILLGSKLTNGPRLPFKNRLRCNLNSFDYYQISHPSQYNAKSGVFETLSSSFENLGKYVMSQNFNELTLRGEGEENTIIADGMHLGRIPATFSFLPKAIRVIAPLQTLKVGQPWHQKVTAPVMPKPLGSRKCLSRKAG